ncbi:MAG: large-conductance mechanosensitive channel protein MscL [Bacilli bacterium]|nr:large-conductance mechanosensitive channel protein MscL [Bacilli bacterium]
MKKFAREFKEFISKGNVMDLAVGVIIGSAFGKIVSSLVDNILMPFIGVIIGGKSFYSLNIRFHGAVINYGVFLQDVVDFIIIAFCVFLIVKTINALNKKVNAKKITEEEAKKKAEAEKPTKDQELLMEIRDLLKKNK